MITLEQLKEFGADTDKGLAMCMGNEALYLRLVSSVPGEARFDDLTKALETKDLDAAFEAAHALKGVLGNLSLTPLLTSCVTITELLRNRTDTDYSGYLAELTEKQKELSKLCEN